MKSKRHNQCLWWITLLGHASCSPVPDSPLHSWLYYLCALISKLIPVPSTPRWCLSWVKIEQWVKWMCIKWLGLRWERVLITENHSDCVEALLFGMVMENAITLWRYYLTSASNFICLFCPSGRRQDLSRSEPLLFITYLFFASESVKLIGLYPTDDHSIYVDSDYT